MYHKHTAECMPGAGVHLTVGKIAGSEFIFYERKGTNHLFKVWWYFKVLCPKITTEHLSEQNIFMVTCYAITG